MSQFFYIKNSIHNNISHNYKITTCFFSHFIITNIFNNSFKQIPFNYFLFNNNFNRSFNQTYILTQSTIIKIDFLKLFF
jgi:ribosomal protein S8E